MFKLFMSICVALISTAVGAQTLIQDGFSGNTLPAHWVQTAGNSSNYTVADGNLNILNASGGYFDGNWTNVTFKTDFVATDSFYVYLKYLYQRVQYRGFDFYLYNNHNVPVVWFRIWDSPSHWILLGNGPGLGGPCSKEISTSFTPSDLRIFRSDGVIGLGWADSLKWQCAITDTVSSIVMTFSEYQATPPVQMQIDSIYASSTSAGNPTNVIYPALQQIIRDDFTLTHNMWHPGTAIYDSFFVASLVFPSSPDSIIFAADSQSCTVYGYLGTCSVLNDDWRYTLELAHVAGNWIHPSGTVWVWTKEGAHECVRDTTTGNPAEAIYSALQPIIRDDFTLTHNMWHLGTAIYDSFFVASLVFPSSPDSIIFAADSQSCTVYGYFGTCSVLNDDWRYTLELAHVAGNWIHLSGSVGVWTKEGAHECVRDSTYVSGKMLYVGGPIACAEFNSLLALTGLEINYSADIPEPSILKNYNVVVVATYPACNPTTAGYLSEFEYNGGGVILLGGTPLFLGCANQPWFGGGGYANSWGSIAEYVDNPAPFVTGLSAGAILTDHSGGGGGDAGIAGTMVPSHTLGKWRDGPVFAFWNTYGAGRLYYGACAAGCGQINESGNRTLWASAIKWIAGRYYSEDADGDGIPNVTDNCPQVANPDQQDTDGDGIGDACDPNSTPSDTLFVVGGHWTLNRTLGRLCLGDLNGDGSTDVAVLEKTTNSVGILLNNGSGTLSSPNYFPCGVRPWSLDIGSLNLDRTLDIAVANNPDNNSTASVLFNRGLGVYDSPIAYTSGFRPVSVVLTDIDGDHDLDMIVANHDGSIPVFENDGSGQFHERTRIGIGNSPICVRSGDLDSDGDADLVVLNRWSFDLAILLNNGSGDFQFVGRYPANMQPEWVSIADFDGDGDRDLVVVGQAGLIMFYRNRGNAIFDSPVATTFAGMSWQLAEADFDGDGDIDLAATNSALNSVDVFLNDGTGSFTPFHSCPVGSLAYSMCTGDMNGDGLPDLVVSCESSQDIYVLLNHRRPVITDSDNDGMPDIQDNCPTIANADQTDADADGLGDVCDPDDDNDGLLDPADNCPLAFNPDQRDRDADGIGNVCDPMTSVFVDIKPGACPNPFNAKSSPHMELPAADSSAPVMIAKLAPPSGEWSKEILPVAILGTSTVDVSSVNPSSIRLVGMAPVRSALEDVGTPQSAGAQECACNTYGPDGYPDLTLKFYRDSIAAALGTLNVGETKRLKLTGKLNDGSDLEGYDCIVIVGSAGAEFAPPAGDNPLAMANFPNPFNPSSTISFTLSQAGSAKLDIFNNLGQRVTTLVDEHLSAGVHTFTWDASGQASGLYLYRLTTGDFSETKKMLLLK